MSVEMRRVADLAEQIRGVSYSKADASLKPMEGYVPVLRAGNITDNGLQFDDFVYVPEDKVKKKQLVRANDIVIAASSGSLDVVGKAARALSDFHGGFGAFCKVLRPREDIDPSYFAHYFKTQEYRRKVSNLAAGANINNLRNGDLDELLIPVPPLEEQKRIAKILDAAHALRTKRRESLAQLDALLQCTFIDVFGDPVINKKKWETVLLDDCLESIDSGWSPKCLDRSAEEGEWGVLKLGAVTRCVYDDREQKALPQNFEPRVRIEVHAGDLLFTRKNTRELVCAAAYVMNTRPKLMLPDLIFRLKLRHDSQMRALFLWQLLVNPRQRKKIQSLAGGAAGSMPNISKSKLKGVSVIMPPIELQEKYSRIVRSIENEKRKVEAHNSELDSLFSSLQVKAFSGEL